MNRSDTPIETSPRKQIITLLRLDITGKRLLCTILMEILHGILFGPRNQTGQMRKQDSGPSNHRPARRRLTGVIRFFQEECQGRCRFIRAILCHAGNDNFAIMGTERHIRLTVTVGNKASRGVDPTCRRTEPDARAPRNASATARKAGNGMEGNSTPHPFEEVRLPLSWTQFFIMPASSAKHRKSLFVGRIATRTHALRKAAPPGKHL